MKRIKKTWNDFKVFYETDAMMYIMVGIGMFALIILPMVKSWQSYQIQNSAIIVIKPKLLKVRRWIVKCGIQDVRGITDC